MIVSIMWLKGDDSHVRDPSGVTKIEVRDGEFFQLSLDQLELDM